MGNRLLSLCSLVVALFIGSTASALTITFDELPVGTVVDGMVIGNVTFGFSSPDAVIDGGPGVTAFIDLPNIEGDASGLLTLSFATPVLSVSYGFALSTSVPVNPGTVMEFFDTGGGLLVVPANLSDIASMLALATNIVKGDGGGSDSSSSGRAAIPR